MQTINRREYLKTMAASSAGMMFLSQFGFFQCAKANASVTPGLGRLTEFTLLDDVAELAVQSKWVSPSICELIKADLNNNIPSNLSRMGALVPGPESEVLAILKEERENTKKISADLTDEERNDPDSKPMKAIDKSLRKQALMMGWFLASGIREIMFKEPGALKEEEKMPDERSVYRDMFILKKIAGKSGQASSHEVASLFNEMVVRFITRTHTLTPDYDDGPNWTVRITDWHNDNMMLMNQYAEAWVNPDPSKIQVYLYDSGFFNDKDGLIKLAWKVQSGQSVNAQDVEKELKWVDASSCHYSRAIAEGLKALKRCEAVLEG